MYLLTVRILFCVLSIAVSHVAANDACTKPFQQHPTRTDLCYTSLPRRKCYWIAGSVYLKGNCFVPSGYDGIPSRKFFCDFNEYFQHCKNVPGYCCMQSTKFECDKYTVVEYNATLGTCFAPVGEINLRTSNNVKCLKRFKYDDSFRQCVADLKPTKRGLTAAQCKKAGGYVNETKCIAEVIQRIKKPSDCTNVTNPDCLPPPFTTTTLLPTTTFETTEPTTTDEPKTTMPASTGTTRNDSSSDGLTSTTSQPPTANTDKMIHDPTIGQVEANAACQVPFQQHPTRPDLCYTRLPKRKCDWIPGSRFIQGNCFVPSGHDVVPSRKFFCDFNEYFQHCKNVPGYCCMQST
uniref:DUF4789 domain-containing protein n=1 Tax=Panagrellus redivivus TaxID=6233 RepID=A0A7E4VGV5_PANRE